MSSPDGRTLKEFVSEGMMGTTIEQDAAIVRLLEPHREYIEQKVAEWYADGDDASSWRDYRNMLWETIVHENSELDRAIKKICEEKE